MNVCFSTNVLESRLFELVKLHFNYPKLTQRSQIFWRCMYLIDFFIYFSINNPISTNQTFFEKFTSQWAYFSKTFSFTDQYSRKLTYQYSFLKDRKLVTYIDSPVSTIFIYFVDYTYSRVKWNNIFEIFASEMFFLGSFWSHCSQSIARLLFFDNCRFYSSDRHLNRFS